MDNILRSRNRNWLLTKISSIFVIFSYFLIEEGGARQNLMTRVCEILWKFKFVRHAVHSSSFIFPRVFHRRDWVQSTLVQAVDLRRNSDAEAWSHSICIAP
jgi:hypothetical protein